MDTNIIGIRTFETGFQHPKLHNRRAMGIPLYFHKITNHFKNVVSPQKPKRCDRLFLDFNGVVHNCARDIRASATATGVTQDEFETLLINDIIAYTETLREFARPKHLLCICIDGVAPLSKIQQQRKRRYLSAWMKSKVKEDGYAWDTNAISPGTPFMHKLNAALKKFVDEKNDQPHQRGPHFHLSDSTERGEGEHKIFDLVQKLSYKEDYVDVIYGLDADLIMLSMLCTRTKKYLMREPQNFSSVSNPTNAPFLWFDVDVCRTKVLEYYEQGVDIESYVILCVLIGNDFLPNLTYLTIFNGGIDAIMTAYKQVVSTGCGPIVYREENDVYVLNMNTLSLLLNELKSMEDDECKKLHDKYHKKTMVLHTHKLKIENYGITHKNMSTKNMFVSSNWRFNYYTNLFDMNIYKDSVITDSCCQYIHGLLWMVEYYLNKRAASNWCYMFNYSPTILDLYNYLEVNKKQLGNATMGLINSEGSLIDEDTQLLMIMPIGSIGVLPPKLRKLVSTDMLVRHFYPNTFKIETYLKTKLHECYPILPQLESYNYLV